MSLSVGMNNALLSLIDINTQISTVSGQLQSGQRFNSAADGAVQWLQISDFNNRASQLTTINDGLSVALGQTKSASTSLTDLRAKLVATQTSLNDAYTSQAAVKGTDGVVDTPSADPNTFKLNFTLDPNSTLKSFNGNSLLDGNILINNNRVHAGDAITVGVGKNAITFKIAPDSATVAASTQDAYNKLSAQVGVDGQTVGKDNDLLNQAKNTLNGAQSNLNYGYTNATSTNVQVVIGTLDTNKNLAAGPGVTKGFDANYLNYIAANLQTSATAVTAQQYVDGLHQIATGVLPGSKGVTAAGALSNLQAMAGQTANTSSAMGLLAGYASALLAVDSATTAANNAVNAQNADTAALKAMTPQSGSTTAPYLVATVDDYLNLLTSFKDENNNQAIKIDQAAPDQYSPLTSFSAVGTASLPLSVTRVATGNPNDVADVRSLFASTYDSTAGDPTKPYDQASWAQNGNTYTLSNVHHTGSTPGTTKTPADAKRKVAANTFRQMLIDIDQTVKDSGLNGVNLLLGSKLSVALNTEGDKFNFQLTNPDGTPASYNSAGLGLDLKATNLDGTDGGNNFDNNADMDVALAEITAAISAVDTGTGLVGDAQNSLQQRSDFNKSMASLMTTTATTISSVDTSAASAQLAALQTRQQFATSIMSILKQSDQNPLQLLR